jgi:hypothetical protein
MSQDGRAVAYVISNRYREELITRNLVTGQHDTITIATDPDGTDNNWPPGVGDLTWSPDDRQLALALQPTAAISSVLVLGAFTATSISEATTAPAPCPIARELPQCTETDPAYLAGGALSYAIQQTSDRGGTSTVTTRLVAWRAGRAPTTLHVFADGLSQTYDMTPQGQAIWVESPASPGGPWAIWCWSGGSVTKITTLPVADSPSMVVWLSPGASYRREPAIAGSQLSPGASYRREAADGADVAGQRAGSGRMRDKYGAAPADRDRYSALVGEHAAARGHDQDAVAGG